jgi:tetratricopeptide (TPR) repeat protein
LEREKADRRAEAERKAKEDAEISARETADRASLLHAALKKENQARRDADLASRRARWLALAAISVALIAVAACVAAVVAQSAAQAAKERAVTSKKAADELINFMQYDLSNTLRKLGQLQMMHDINTRIRRYHEEHAAEAGDAPARDAADRERSVALGQQGDILFALGDLASALKSYHDSLGIFEKLAKQDPSNTGWQRDLSSCYAKIGAVLQAQGDLASALKSYRNSLGIFEKLAKQDPSNADWQHDLSICYEKVGNVQSARGDLVSALKSYRDSLGIFEKLAKQDPSNADWLRHSYERIGDVLLAQRDLAGALKSYRDSLGIAEKLAKQDPSNAIWQNSAARGRYCVAKVLIQIKDSDPNEARRLVVEGIDIMKRLEHEGALDVNAQDTLNKLNELAPSLSFVIEPLI